jgi:hypothetical protein
MSDWDGVMGSWVGTRMVWLFTANVSELDYAMSACNADDLEDESICVCVCLSIQCVVLCAVCVLESVNFEDIFIFNRMFPCRRRVPDFVVMFRTHLCYYFLYYGTSILITLGYVSIVCVCVSADRYRAISH